MRAKASTPAAAGAEVRARTEADAEARQAREAEGRSSLEAMEALEADARRKRRRGGDALHPVPPATAQPPPQQSPQQPQKRPPQRQAQQRPPQQSPQRQPQQSAQRRDGRLRQQAPPTQERWAAAAEASGLEAQLDAAKTARDRAAAAAAAVAAAAAAAAVAAERVTAEYAAQVRGMHAARSAAAAERQRQRQRQQGGAPRGLPGAYAAQAPTPSGALTPPVAAVELATSSTDALVQRVRLGGCPFRCLGLERGASQEEVRKRYRALALRLHPDKAQHPQANEAFAALKSAYSRAKEAAAAAAAASAVWAARPSASARPRAAS